jgi:hypothetical protein
VHAEVTNDFSEAPGNEEVLHFRRETVVADENLMATQKSVLVSE